MALGPEYGTGRETRREDGSQATVLGFWGHQHYRTKFNIHVCIRSLYFFRRIARSRTKAVVGSQPAEASGLLELSDGLLI